MRKSEGLRFFQKNFNTFYHHTFYSHACVCRSFPLPADLLQNHYP